jgi:hypothetical protein
MHATKSALLFALPLLSLFVASPARSEEPEPEPAAPARAEEPQWLEVRIQSGKALVIVPILDDETEVWSAASSGDKAFPARLDALRPATFVVPGTSLAPGAFVGYQTEGGASDMWWVMVFEAAGTSDAEGLAIVGDVASPQLRAPGLVSLASASGQEHLLTIRNLLDTKLSAADRRRLGKKVLSKSRVQIVEGSFPADATLLVAVNVPMRGELGMSISTMFTMTSDGRVATMLHAPKLRLERFVPHALGDVDADGFDDVIVKSSYYEGAYDHLLRWPDASPAQATIAGDGA